MLWSAWLCRKERGQEATLSNTSARGDSDRVALPGKGGAAENILPFLSLHTDGKLSPRQQNAGRPKDHCWVKWGLAPSCSLTIPSFTGSAEEKAKGEVLPWLPSTPQDSAAPSQTSQPSGGVSRPCHKFQVFSGNSPSISAKANVLSERTGEIPDIWVIVSSSVNRAVETSTF